MGLQVASFVVFAVVTFLFLYGAFAAIRRSHQDDLPNFHSIVIAGQPISLSVQPALRVISLGISIVFAGVTGFALMAQWPTLALFWYAPHATGSVADPIFGKPLNFFLFTLPAWQLIDNWLLTLAITTCAVAVLFLIITSGARSLAKRHITYGSVALARALRHGRVPSARPCNDCVRQPVSSYRSNITRSLTASPTPTRTS